MDGSADGSAEAVSAGSDGATGCATPGAGDAPKVTAASSDEKQPWQIARLPFLIQGEDPELYVAFQNGVLAEFSPEGFLEHALAGRVIAAFWRLRRAEVMEAALFAELWWDTGGAPANPGLALIRDGHGSRGFAALVRYRKAAWDEAQAALSSLETMQAARSVDDDPDAPDGGDHGSSRSRMPASRRKTRTQDRTPGGRPGPVKAPPVRRRAARPAPKDRAAALERLAADVRGEVRARVRAGLPPLPHIHPDDPLDYTEAWADRLTLHGLRKPRRN